MTLTPRFGETLVVFHDNRRLIDLCGAHDENLGRIERHFGIQIIRRGNRIALIGDNLPRTRCEAAMKSLYNHLEINNSLQPVDIDFVLNSPHGQHMTSDSTHSVDESISNLVIVTRRKKIEPKNPSQKKYVQALFSDDLVFGIGPAGTGKTYLAVAVGVSMFLNNRVERIVLSRPAVEAGERIGFLPGDMKEKVDPYMQPLYDALYDFLPSKTIDRLIDDRKIEIAPLAFMRGRTLSTAFILLDEAQNTTRMQMQMFLTRLGNGSKMVVTGDITQIDLPKGQISGLVDAQNTLKQIQDIRFTGFSSEDVMRHHLVGRIIDAYARR